MAHPLPFPVVSQLVPPRSSPRARSTSVRWVSRSQRDLVAASLIFCPRDAGGVAEGRRS